MDVIDNPKDFVYFDIKVYEQGKPAVGETDHTNKSSPYTIPSLDSCTAYDIIVTPVYNPKSSVRISGFAFSLLNETTGNFIADYAGFVPENNGRVSKIT